MFHRFLRHRSPARLAASLGLPACLLLALAPRAAAQTLVYGLSETGKVVVNGTVLDALKTDFDPDTTMSTEQKWWDLAVQGKDRYALRLDGRVAKNGVNLYKLPFFLFNGAPWFGLSVTSTKVCAIRADGLLSTNGVDVQKYPLATFFFQNCLAVGTDAYALRTDGAVFKNISTTPLIQFVGGAGGGGALDGAAFDTYWVMLAVHPISGDLWALRRDGRIWKQNPAASGTPPFAGTKVVDLPFPTGANPADVLDAQRYTSLDFTADGTFHALRGDGAVFTDASATVPLIDLPGSASGAPQETFFDLATSDTGFFGLRWDGKIFDEGGGSALFDMTGERYRRVAVSETPPDLTHFKNPKPVAAIYKSRTILGVPLTVPILVSDIEKLPADLVVTAPDVLPTGAVWDDVTRTLTWADPGPVGTYKFSVTASDGVNPPKVFKHAIKVLPADASLLKNKAPLPTKITQVQALVGFPISFPVFAVDPDGDAIAMSVNTAKAPFNAGATFDTLTNTFSWTPTFDDIGKVTAHFLVSDGTKTVTLSVVIRVVNPLIF